MLAMLLELSTEIFIRKYFNILPDNKTIDKKEKSGFQILDIGYIFKVQG